MKSFGLESEIDRSSKDKDSKTLPLYYYVENYIIVGFPCRYSRGAVDDICRLQISWYFKTRSSQMVEAHANWRNDCHLYHDSIPLRYGFRQHGDCVPSSAYNMDDMRYHCLVKRTEYNLQTDKELGIDSLKVVGFSDSHIGATFHWQEFEQYIEQINKENPDIVVIIGDYVDDDTSKEDMERSCEALKMLKTRYGVYYVYGNHDEGYWANNRRGYTIKDLDQHLVQNKVRILRDETVAIAGNVILCGRLDKSFGDRNKTGRLDASSLMANTKGKYVICLDHQPNDYAEEADSKIDLVLSGHTHGGQFWGLGTIGVWMGANDAYYGYERKKNTDFIVSSGIGDWAIAFKTGCISEYIVVNIKGK